MVDAIEITALLLVVGLLTWVGWKILVFLYERDLLAHRGAGKIAIQTLFHGNTKDRDQI